MGLSNLLESAAFRRWKNGQIAGLLSGESDLDLVPISDEEIDKWLDIKGSLLTRKIKKRLMTRPPGITLAAIVAMGKRYCPTCYASPGMCLCL